MERYFLGNNSGGGFFSFYGDALRGAERVFLLKGGPGTGKSTFMKQIARECAARNLDYEEWYCSGDPASLDGIYIKDTNFAVVDATAPHAVDPEFPVLKEKIINLGDALSRDILVDAEKDIKSAIYNKKRHFNDANRSLKCALCCYNDLLKIESNCVNEAEIRLYASNLSHKTAGKRVYAADVKKRFNKVIAPDGEKAFYDCLHNKEIISVTGSEYATKIFFETLSGETARGVFLYKPLAPAEVDGIITEGKAFVADVGYLENSISEIIDLGAFEKGFDPETVACAEYEREEVKRLIASAEVCLNSAREAHLLTEKFYVAAMDFDALNEIKNKAMKEIF